MRILIFLANSIRQRVKALRSRYKTVQNAESKLGLDVDHYMGFVGDSEHDETQPRIKITPENWNSLSHLTQSQKVEAIEKIFPTLDTNGKMTCCKDIFLKESDDIQDLILSLILIIVKSNDLDNNNNKTMKFLDELYMHLAVSTGITSNPRNFGSISIKAMARLQSAKKPNLVYKFSEMLTAQKSLNVTEPVIKLDRMPFGLLDYTIQFFTCPNVRQVQKISPILLVLLFFMYITA